jgi:hypothetical protein
MLNPLLKVPIQGDDFTKLDATRFTCEAFLKSTKIVVDAQFGTLGKKETTVPTILTVEQAQAEVSDVETAKTNQSQLIIEGNVAVFSSTKIKMFDNKLAI